MAEAVRGVCGKIRSGKKKTAQHAKCLLQKGKVPKNGNITQSRFTRKIVVFFPYQRQEERGVQNNSKNNDSAHNIHGDNDA